ncbi:MAG: hypothetical protein JWQ14_3310, partial [Adhaeribacter sp.]|nr:hypothetical protein [Adhaeribacter sp.]
IFNLWNVKLTAFLKFKLLDYHRLSPKYSTLSIYNIQPYQFTLGITFPYSVKINLKGSLAY